MFRSRNKRQRQRSDARTSSVRRSRSRRLTIEAMESRLLLSGNQTSGGDLDYSIWNLDSIQNNYAIIAQDDSLPAASSSTASAAGSGREFNLLSGSSLIGSVSTVYIAPPLLNSLGWSSPSPSLDLTTTQYDYMPRGLDDDVRSSGEFDRDGKVTANDYMVWRDVVGASDMLAYNNWQENFGKSYILDSIIDNSLSDSLTVDRGGVLDPQHTLSNDFTATNDTSTSNGPLTAGFDAMLGSQGDIFVNVTTLIHKLYPGESPVDASPLTGEAIADQRLVVTIGPVTIVTANDANFATWHSALIVDADGGAHPRVLSRAAVLPDRQSKADDDLAEAIDELLSEDVILVDHSGQAASETIADATPMDVAGSTEIASAGASADGDARIDQLAEGGLISVEDIVGAVARGSAGTVPASTQIASDGPSDGASAELVGELSRIAVMELIEGEAEPGTPQAAADHVSLLATGDGNGIDAAEAEQTAALRAFQVIAEQAGTVTAMIVPVNSAFVATIVDAASDAFMAVVGMDLADLSGETASESASVADTARGEAFSQWGDESGESQAATESESSRWLDAAPLLVALACERAVAAKKKRLQRDPIHQPIKAK